MALIHCPECNREISDTVKVCLDCGYKLKQPKREPKFLKTREGKKTFIIIVCVILAGILALGGYYGYNNYIVPTNQYKAAVTLGEQGKYEDAIKAFRELGAFKDSQTKVKEMKYQWAGKTDLDKSISLYEEIGDYKDTQQKLEAAKAQKKAQEALAKLATAYNKCSASGTSLSSDRASIIVDALNKYDYDAASDVLVIIKTLGLPDSLYDEMCETNALMGRQTESYEYYDVSWSYHPDNGLDVIFKYKN